MTVFLDTNVFVAAASGQDRDSACARLLAAVIHDNLEAKTSVGVIEEIWHLEMNSTIPLPRGAASQVVALMTPLLSLDERVVLAALELPAERIGANDRIFAATCVLHGIDTIVTADRAFDELDRPRRLDPLDAPAQLL